MRAPTRIAAEEVAFLAATACGCHAVSMKVEELVFGVMAVAWGILLWVMRPELLQFAREGGKGLRDRRVINGLVISAGILLPLGGMALIALRAF